MLAAPDLAWAAERGHVTLLEEHRLLSVATGDGIAQLVRVCSPTEFVSLNTIGEALGCAAACSFFATWRDELDRRGYAAPACPVTGEPADDCDHVGLAQVQPGGER